MAELLEGMWTFNTLDGELVVSFHSRSGRKVLLSISKEQIDDFLDDIQEMENDDPDVVCS